MPVAEQTIDFQPDEPAIDFVEDATASSTLDFVAEDGPSPSARAVIPFPSQEPARQTPVDQQAERMHEAKLLQDRFHMALELTQDPGKRQFLHDDYRKKLRQIGIEPIDFQPDIVKAGLSPLATIPRVSDEDMETLFPGSQVAQALGGGQRVVAGAAEAMTAPIVLALPALSGGARQAASGAFAVDMARHVPELAQEAGKASVEGGIGQQVEATGNLITTSVFSAGAGAHALGIGSAPLARSEIEKILRPEKPSVVEAEALPNVPRETIAPKPDALAPAVIVEKAELSAAPATAKALQDVTGQPEVTTPEAIKKGVEATNEVKTDAQEKGRSEELLTDEAGGEQLMSPPASETPKPETPPEVFTPLNELLEQATGGGQRLGVKAGAKIPGTLPPVKVPGGTLASESPAVEARWQAAHGIGSKSIYERFKAGVRELVTAFRRHFPKLEPKTDGQQIEILRQFEATPNLAKEAAGQTMRAITAGFTPDHLNVFERVVVLRDLLRDVSDGKYEGRDIPIGYENEGALRADLDKFEAIAKENPGIWSALERRGQVWGALGKRMVEADLLPESVLDRPDYFHRQILQYMRMKEEATSGTSSADVRTHTKGFQRKRTHSSKDYNTAYLEAEFEVMAQAFAQLNTVETLGKLDQSSNIRRELDAAAKDARDAGDPSAKWQDYIPADYTVWQPKKGNVLYWVNSLADKIVEKILSGEKLLEQTDLNEVLAVGGKREEWVIPKRLAETLDDYKAQPDQNPLERFSAGTSKLWKKITLFSPPHLLRYELNNFSGDLDISLAWRPQLLGHVKQAAADAWDYRIKTKAPTPEQIDLIKKGVIGSGFFTEELGGISRHQLFDAMTRPDRNVIERYFDTVEKYNAFREDVLRLAAYRYTLAEMQKGKPTYGASNKAEVDAIPDIADKAAKVSRELIGDYGNVSRAGQWIRRHMIPFYSWMEINAPRYVRLLRNIQHEDPALKGKATARVAGSAAFAGAKFTAKAAGLYAIASLWNRTFFPEEDDELNRDRKQMHLILGRDEEGNIRSLRFQGALSDALSWVGAEDAPSDIADLGAGKKSVGHIWREAGLAPVNKLVNASMPIAKTVVESSLGLSTYPGPFEVKEGKDGLEVDARPRVIRDPIEHMARLFSVGGLYRRLAQIPTPGVRADLAKLVSYTTNPGESAYFAAREIVSDFATKQGKEYTAVLPTDKSNALFYHKQAVKYKDETLAAHWKQRYIDLGGTERGMSQSIARMHPLGGIKKSDHKEFLEHLSAEDQAIVSKAIKYFEKTYK